MPRPRVLVVQNTPTGGPKRLGPWWAEDGLDLDIVHGYDGADVPTSTDGYDGVAIFGGGFMPDDLDSAPWLGQARELVEFALEDEIPYLGICLGGQLLAQTAGGRVEADAGAPEVGSTRITIRRDAADDALFGRFPQEVTAVENHVDVIEELPQDAVWLASSQRCPHQAFRIGTVAWGLQFHPETSARDVDGWSDRLIESRKFDPDEVRERTRSADPVAEPQWRRLAAQFAAVVAG